MLKDLISLLKNAEIDRVKVSVAAGQATTNGDSVDLANWEGVVFILSMGAIASTGTVKMHVETSSDDSSFNDVEGSEVDADSDDDDGLLVIDYYAPLERYVRPVVITATADGEIDSIVAIKYGPRKAPVSENADVIASTLLVSTAEGTK